MYDDESKNNGCEEGLRSTPYTFFMNHPILKRNEALQQSGTYLFLVVFLLLSFRRLAIIVE